MVVETILIPLYAIFSGSDTAFFSIPKLHREIKEKLYDYLEIKSCKLLKWYVCITIRFRRLDKELLYTGYDYTVAYFHSKTVKCNPLEIDSQIEFAIDQILAGIDKYEGEGSGWIIDEFLEAYIKIFINK